MATAVNRELDQTQALLDELRRYEEEVRTRFEAELERVATRPEATGRWPFAGGWHTEREIQRFRRQAWFRWIVVRLEGLVLIGLTLFFTLFVRVILLSFLPK